MTPPDKDHRGYAKGLISQNSFAAASAHALLDIGEAIDALTDAVRDNTEAVKSINIGTTVAPPGHAKK